MSSIIRLYIDQSISNDAQLTLSAEQAHYLTSVMRKTVGEPLHIFNGTDGEWLAEISEAKKKHCLITVKESLRNQENGPDLTLCFAPIKKQRLDFIMEKATELGVTCFQPIITSRTITSKIRSDRLKAQVIEASEQCERLDIPNVLEELNFRDFIQGLDRDKHLVILDERGTAEPVHKVLSQLGQEDADKSKSYAIVVGPEGGFSPEEFTQLEKRANISKVSVGPRVLRADTAALAAISCWQSVLGDWQQPLRDRRTEEE